MRDDPNRGVGDMAIRGQTTNFEGMFIEGSSGPDGKFTVRSPSSSDVYLHAVSADRKTQGIAFAKQADLAKGVTIPVGPTGIGGRQAGG